MIACVRSRCGKALQPDWAFCPFCGQDNRPPSGRIRVANCPHEFDEGDFCVGCGISGKRLALQAEDDAAVDVYSFDGSVLPTGDSDGQAVFRRKLVSDRKTTRVILAWRALIGSLIFSGGPWLALSLLLRGGSKFLQRTDTPTTPEWLRASSRDGDLMFTALGWFFAMVGMVLLIYAMVLSAVLFRSTRRSDRIQAIAMWVIVGVITLYGIIHLDATSGISPWIALGG